MDHEMDIEQSMGDPEKIRGLIPYVESILWGCQKLNLTCVSKLTKFLFESFGA